jgi:hypothetical protein
MVTRAARLDDDDDIYDPRFPGKKVVRDGKGIRVPIQLTDGQPPEWMRTQRRPVFDASRHRPGPINVLGDAALKDAKLAAMDAYEQRNDYLRDAWRTSTGGPGGAAHTTAPPADKPDPDDTMSPRDRYIAGLQTAYRTPMGQAPAASADNVAAISRNWLSPGARPGGPGYGDSGSRVSRETMQDARDAADRDLAYAEYVTRISGAWRTR